MKKKKEIILLEELATLEQFKEEQQRNIYPLGLTLSSAEVKEYTNWKKATTGEHKNNVAEEADNYSIFSIIAEMYFLIHEADGNNKFILNAYRLREKIADGKIFVCKFIDKDYQEKPVAYISESYGYDMDAPRIVFGKYPRRIFRQFDFYNPSTDNREKGIDLIVLSHKVALNQNSN